MSSGDNGCNRYVHVTDARKGPSARKKKRAAHAKHTGEAMVAYSVGYMASWSAPNRGGASAAADAAHVPDQRVTVK